MKRLINSGKFTFFLWQRGITSKSKQQLQDAAKRPDQVVVLSSPLKSLSLLFQKHMPCVNWLPGDPVSRFLTSQEVFNYNSGRFFLFNSSYHLKLLFMRLDHSQLEEPFTHVLPSNGDLFI